MSMPKITFLGAAGTVTGSRFLLESSQSRVLIDCGLFQGLKALRLRNWEPFGVDPASIDAVVLSHAHLDHCGYLPRLVKLGYRNRIYATKYTAKLAEVILRDSARIQTEDAKYAAKKGFSKHNPPLPLYDADDAEKAISKFREESFHHRVQVAADCWVTFYPAGHILGAAFLDVEIGGKRILFTGDMGRPWHPLLAAPEAVPAGHFDAIVTESTYGDREHIAPSGNFAEAINRTVRRGGTVLIPAFAVDRTEVILVELRDLMVRGEIDRVPVYADSPMALKALAYYRQAIDEHSSEIRPEIADAWAGLDPFDPGTLVELQTVEESKSVNVPKQPSIIISASGMATGGRVVHHLAHLLPNADHTVILVGYQALGTRGRALADGAEFVKMHGELVKVRAQIERIDSFSVHADAKELIAWMRTATEKPGQVLIIHGEEGAADALATKIQADLGWKTLVPKASQIVAL